MAKNIVIIGDSWSISERNGYVDGYQPFEYELMTPYINVFARGHGGSNNLYELQQFDYFLSNTATKMKIDHVIWFHTELMRDITCLGYGYDNLTVDQYLDKIAEITYTVARSIHLKHPKIKWTIIGGHEPIIRHKHILESFATVLIEDWRSELLGEKMPYANFLGHLTHLKNNIKSIGVQRIEEEIYKRDIIMKACEGCKDLFYDGIHPNSKAFNMLAKRLRKELKL